MYEEYSACTKLIAACTKIQRVQGNCSMYEKYCGFSTKYCAHTNLIAERYVGVKKIISIKKKVPNLCINKKNFF